MRCRGLDKGLHFRFGYGEPAERRLQAERKVGSVELWAVTDSDDDRATCVRDLLQTPTNGVRINVETKLVAQCSTLRLILPLLDLLYCPPSVTEVAKELTLCELAS